MTSKWWKAAVMMALAAGCGGGEEEPPPGDDPTQEQSLRCTSAEYRAFDPVNHAPQDLRLQRIKEIVDLFAAGDAAANAALAKSKYEAADANLAAKVQGREDLHFGVGDPRRDVGAGLHQTILDAIEQLRVATTSKEISLAKQKVEKNGFYRFLYLSVNEELREPSYQHYDEAYGYLGTGQTNEASARLGLAALATRRDANNGTTLAAELFSLIKEGSCVLETSLATKNANTMGLNDDPAYATLVKTLDERMQLVFVYSVGHELFDLVAANGDPDVKLVEASGFFETLEPYLVAEPETSPKGALGRALRDALELAEEKRTANEDWKTGFDAAGLLQQIETAYAIDVKA